MSVHSSELNTGFIIIVTDTGISVTKMLSLETKTSVAVVTLVTMFLPHHRFKHLEIQL